jgi:hypothetical protein
VIIEELEEIQDPKEARTYLEKMQLIVPPGEIISPGLLSMTLHHISKIKNVPKQAINAIRSVAFLLDEMEENS